MIDLFEDCTSAQAPKRSRTLRIETYRDRPGSIGGMTTIGEWTEALTESEGRVFTVRSREIGDRTFVVVSRDDGTGMREVFGSAPTDVARPLVSRLIDRF